MENTPIYIQTVGVYQNRQSKEDKKMKSFRIILILFTLCLILSVCNAEESMNLYGCAGSYGVYSDKMCYPDPDIFPEPWPRPYPRPYPWPRPYPRPWPMPYPWYE